MHRAIGLTLNETGLRAVEVAGSRRRLRVSRTWELPWRDSGERHAALSRLAREAEPHAQWVLGVPGERVSYRLLKLPSAGAARLIRGLAYALEDQVPDDVDLLAVSHLVLSRGALSRGAETEVLALAMSSAELDELIQPLQVAGIDPQQVVPADLAGWFFFGERLVDDWLLDACASPPVLLAFRHGRPVARHIFSSQHPDALEYRWAALAMAEEAGALPQRLHVLGEMADAQGAFPGVMVEPLVARPVGGLAYDREAALACAALLPGPRLSLRTGELAYQGDARRYRRGLAAAAALGLLWLVAWIAQLVVQLAQLQGEVHALQQQTLAVFRQVMPGARPVDIVLQMQQRLTQLQAAPAVAGSGSALKEVLAVLDAVPADAGLRLDEFGYEPPRIALRGDLASAGALERWRRALELSGRYAAIAMGPAGGAVASSRPPFSLSLQLRGGS